MLPHRRSVANQNSVSMGSLDIFVVFWGCESDIPVDNSYQLSAVRSLTTLKAER
jgi:hypothetical protein